MSNACKIAVVVLAVLLAVVFFRGRSTTEQLRRDSERITERLAASRGALAEATATAIRAERENEELTTALFEIGETVGKLREANTELRRTVARLTELGGQLDTGNTEIESTIDSLEERLGNAIERVRDLQAGSGTEDSDAGK